MDFLTTPQSIYETLTAKAENVWVTVYPDPGGKNNCLFAGEGDPSDQWHLVESIIRNAAGRYNRFKIRIALGTKNAMPQEIPVQVAGMGGQGQQVAGIGNVPGMYGYQAPAADIGAIEKRIEEKFEQRMQHEREIRELKDQIAAKDYEIQQRKKKGDTLDQIGAFCEQQGIDLNPIIQGLVAKLPAMFAARRPMAPMPGLAGVPGRRGADVYRAEEERPVPTDDEQLSTDDETDQEATYELTDEDNRALDALDILRNAGAKNPAEILIKIANFYASDPAKAEGYLNFLQ